MALTDEQLHKLGLAVASVEAAIMADPNVFRAADSQGHAHVVGDATVFALAMKGFVVSYDPEQAAIVAAEYERSPEQGSKLS